MPDDARVPELLDLLDGSGSDTEIDAVRELRELGDDLPPLLLARYRTARRAPVRAACVHYAIRHARTSSEAVRLGCEGLGDRAYVVRYRACMLLAYSLDRGALPALRSAAQASRHAQTQADIAAAVDAIEHGVSDWFVDREHSGRITLTTA